VVAKIHPLKTTAGSYWVRILYHPSP